MLSRYSRLGASSRLRMYQYIPYLEAHGVKVTVAPLLGDAYLEDFYADRPKRLRAIFGAYLRRLGHLLRSCRYDLLWIQYELLPWLPAWIEAVLARLSLPYIVDYDDAVFHRYRLNPRGLVRRLLGGKIDAVMRRSALVTAGNDYLAARARQAGARRVAYLPTVVDLDRYPIIARPEQGAERGTVFTMGWIGTPYTTKYLNLVRPALAEVCRDEGARLVLVGAGQVASELEGVPVEVRSWSEATEVADIQSFDVGIMPLPDDPWERGKCGYKLIQYMACSRPVVASPVGVNQQIVEAGVNGFLVQTAADWVSALNVLRRDDDLRRRMGASGRAKVEAEYCLEITVPRLLSLLRAAQA